MITWILLNLALAAKNACVPLIAAIEGQYFGHEGVFVAQGDFFVDKPVSYCTALYSTAQYSTVHTL